MWPQNQTFTYDSVTCVGPFCPVVTFRHVTRHDSLSKTVLQGILEGGRHPGQQRKYWMDNIKEWTSLPMPELLTGASCRKDWERISAGSCTMSPLTIQSVKGLNWIEVTLAIMIERSRIDLLFWARGTPTRWSDCKHTDTMQQCVKTIFGPIHLLP